MSLLESYKPGTKDYKIWFDGKKMKIEDQTKSQKAQDCVLFDNYTYSTLWTLNIHTPENYSALLHKYINKYYFIN